MRLVVVSTDPERSEFAAAAVGAEATVTISVDHARGYLMHPCRARADAVVVVLDGADSVRLVDELATSRRDLPVVAWGERRRRPDRAAPAAATLGPAGQLGPEVAAALKGAVAAVTSDRMVGGTRLDGPFE